MPQEHWGSGGFILFLKVSLPIAQNYWTKAQKIESLSEVFKLISMFCFVFEIFSCLDLKFLLQTVDCGDWLVVITHIDSGYTDVAGLWNVVF
jgi:hypothetical protein